MAKDIDRNKVSPRERRRAAEIKENLQKQGLGEDEAEKRALRQAVEELQTGQGGGKHSGGEKGKGIS